VPIIDGEHQGDWSGWSVSQSADGSTVAIGAIQNEDNGFESGHVRVFRWDGNVYSQLEENIYGEDAADTFGFSVTLSLDGNVVAAGGPHSNGSGHVRVFGWSGNEWLQIGQAIDSEVGGGQFGASVSLSGDGLLVAVGALKSFGDTGQVYVYELLES